MVIGRRLETRRRRPLPSLAGSEALAMIDYVVVVEQCLVCRESQYAGRLREESGEWKRPWRKLRANNDDQRGITCQLVLTVVTLGRIRENQAR